ncbi:carbon-nitrogen hydrolase family protein [Pseudohalocynthiibacter aestuariivivens]|nr:carbon-nitrogen hydrolase family protein [Pseudohalocynthiibacter aestuariivivens]QIE46491.1 carbon-nitrogen hydrolase family protein [Pseudohalocynthiibacter aestuariivivens]
MKIALLQCPPPPADPERGLLQIADAAAYAAKDGATVLVTPEMAVTGYALGPDVVAALAEPADGAYYTAIADICRANKIAIAYGFPERGGDGAVYNSVQLMTADGTALTTYRKTHLYGDVDRMQFTAGATLSEVVSLGGLRIALAICYDIEFPELVRAYALAGADLVITPTANMVPYDSVCTRIVPARAEENGIAIAYANYIGEEGDFIYCGRSCIVDPGGRDLARALPHDPVLIMAELPDRRAHEGAHLADRRPDLYAALMLPQPARET